MPITLGFNIAALKAQNQLARNTEAQGRVYERLSSGMRINRASDDAAGLAISSALNATSRVYSQGVRNIGDGISAINIADGALSQLGDVLIRVKELAEQSANGTLSNQQRQALDREADALRNEYNRIINTTKFNGFNLLDGTTTELSIQAGNGLLGRLSTSLAAGLSALVGDGTFQTGTPVTAGFVNKSVTLADFNGDGKLDMANSTSNAPNNTLYVSFGDGNGGFGASVDYGTPASGARFITSGDTDGDGDIDLLLSGESSSQVLLYLNDGNGNFTVPGAPYVTTVNNGEIRTADFNGDGRADVATTAGEFIDIFRGESNGTLTQLTSIQITNHNITSVALADVSGDGKMDVVASSESFGTIYLHVAAGNGDGTFGAPNSYALGAALNSGQVKLGDVNRDGILDAAVHDRTNQQIYIRYGDGVGGFGAGTTFNVGFSSGNIGLADLNGDGYADLVTNQTGAATGEVFLGDGTGSFSLSQSIVTSGPAEFGDIPFGDLNQDGGIDFVFSINNQTNAVYLANLAESAVSPFLDEIDLTTRQTALETLDQMGEILNRVIRQRGSLGAFFSRLEVAANVLRVSVENYRSAESRILDADIADESSNLVRLGILQSAGAAVMAQANLQPALALSLLGA